MPEQGTTDAADQVADFLQNIQKVLESKRGQEAEIVEALQ